MAKKPTSKQIEEMQRENLYQHNLSVLNDQEINMFVSAHAAKDISNYGNKGKEATQNEYAQIMRNPGEGIMAGMAGSYQQSIDDAIKNGKDIYDQPVQASHTALLENSANSFFSAANGVKVSDILKILKIKKVHEGNISKEKQDMLMKDFAKSDKEMYGVLISNYRDIVTGEGVAQAILHSNAQRAGGLEQLLSTEPKPKTK